MADDILKDASIEEMKFFLKGFNRGIQVAKNMNLAGDNSVAELLISDMMSKVDQKIYDELKSMEEGKCQES